MARYAALLRAVNVGGTGAVAMKDIRACFKAAGCAHVVTLLQSGNVALDAPTRGGAALEKKLEAALLEHLKLATSVLVRSTDQWAQMIAGNPFTQEAVDDPSHLLALVGRNQPTRQQIATLQNAATASGGGERVADVAGHLYAVYPGGIGRSRFTTAVIERVVCGVITGRNWNTVLKLEKLLKQRPALGAE